MLIPFDYLFSKYGIHTTGVLHLGANTGQEAEVYQRNHIERVVWVEALPSVHAELVQNISKYPGHVALQACVSDVDGQEVVFNVASNGAQSSSFLEFGTHEKEHPTVKFICNLKMQTVRVDTLLERYGITIGNGWFLNIDLQGAELLALRGMGDLLRCFNHAYIEVNTKELYKGCPLVGEIDAYLGANGFVGRETKMTGSGWGDKYYRREGVVL